MVRKKNKNYYFILVKTKCSHHHRVTIFTSTLSLSNIIENIQNIITPTHSNLWKTIRPMHKFNQNAFMLQN